MGACFAMMLFFIRRCFCTEPTFSPSSMLTDVPVRVFFTAPGVTVAELRPKEGDFMLIRSAAFFTNCSGAHLTPPHSNYQVNGHVGVLLCGMLCVLLWFFFS